jgi:hypothetical protein
MNRDIHALFEQLRNTPFPALGKVIGDFALYDSLLAGTVSSFLAGAKVDVEAVPILDQQTAATLSALKKKKTLYRQEADFLKYAQLWDELREEVIKAVKAGGSPPFHAKKGKQWE